MPQPLSRPVIGVPFVELQSVGSTNNYALERVHAGLASHGAAFFAHEQVSGKGQRGKTWVAEKDTSLILSAVVNPAPLSLTQQFQLSACAAVSAYDLFSHYAGDDTAIKWPNDLYWQDRKAGGMLIENVIGGNSLWNWAIIGTGININQRSFDPGLKNPVSLKQITGKDFSTLELAHELCQALERNFSQLSTNGFGEIYNAYNRHLYKRDQPVRFKKGPRIFEAVVQRVTPDGHLVVQHAIQEEIKWGEVEWLLNEK